MTNANAIDSPPLPHLPGSAGNLLRSDGTEYDNTQFTIPTTITVNSIWYGSSSNVVGEIAAAANRVMVTNGSSVPSFATTLPTAVQTNITEVGTITSGTWTGSVIDVTYGGTGASTFTAGQLVYSIGAGSPLANVAAGNSGTILQSNGASAPTWTTAVFASTYAASRLLYSNGANNVQGLATANSATLYTNTSGVPAWTASLTDLQILLGQTASDPVVATITAGSNMTITYLAGNLTFDSTGGSSFTWNTETTTPINMVSGNGYIANSGSQIVFNLPAVSSVGDEIKIVGKGAGGWKVAQAASQLIHVGSSVSTTGATGYIESTDQYDVVSIVCITANTEWSLTAGPQGNITVA